MLCINQTDVTIWNEDELKKFFDDNQDDEKRELKMVKKSV